MKTTHKSCWNSKVSQIRDRCSYNWSFIPQKSRSNTIRTRGFSHLEFSATLGVKILGSLVLLLQWPHTFSATDVKNSESKLVAVKFSEAGAFAVLCCFLFGKSSFRVSHNLGEFCFSEGEIKDAKMSCFSSDLLMSLRTYCRGFTQSSYVLSLSIRLLASLKSISHLRFCEIACVLKSLAELSEHLKYTSW